MPMKAIILSAGYGTRLRPLTDRLPKPLMPVLGTPMLSHIMHRLQEADVSGIGLNLHHKSGMIDSYLKKEYQDSNITLSVEDEILGVAGGILGFREYLKGEDGFIVHNGDILSSISLGRILPRLDEDLPLCTMIVHDHPEYNNVGVDGAGNIIDLRGLLNPSAVHETLAYTGISVMSCDILRLIPEGASDLVPLLAEVIKKEKGRVKAVKAENCDWMDMGTLANYLAAHEKILVDQKPLVDQALIPETPVFLGDNAVLETDVRFSGFVSAGKNTVFKKGCSLENCIVWDNAVIHEGAIIKNAVIGKGWIVNYAE